MPPFIDERHVLGGIQHCSNRLA